jgi:putative photosynthetic complex assembly protein
VFYDARSDRVVKEYASGEGSFIRGTLRAIARERRLQGVGADEPVIVVARADGSIWLEDPQVGSRIALRAFGASNEAAFTPMLAAPQDSK